MTNIAVKKQLPYTFAKRNQILLGDIENETSEILHCDETPLDAIIEARRQTSHAVRLKKIDAEAFQHALTQAFETNQEAAEQIAADIGEESDFNHVIHNLPSAEDLLETQDDAPIIRLLNAIFTQAIKQQASDIHLETFEHNLIVRYRIDGVLREVLRLQRVLSPLIVSRLKVMAKLDIAEKRIPQDGRIGLRIAGHAIDVRVSTVPASHAERVVLRILDKQSAHLDLSFLGMQSDTLEICRQLIAQPHGILLVTGPTGSGKTTSLYAMLTELNQSSRNILTVEDPIEYDLSGIGQMQVNPKVEMTFAKGLRAMLRQDPDVVMVGEIRDLETADIAVQASLTGHLVFSTLHTNTALGAIARLRDMGVEPFLLSSSLIGLLAQRLVRKLCPACKTPYKMTSDECKLLEVNEDHTHTVFEASGCEACNQTGYAGRTGIYELIPVDKTLRSMIHNNQSEQVMEDFVRTSSPSIRHDGFMRVLQGETSIAEVLRVTREE